MANTVHAWLCMMQVLGISSGMHANCDKDSVRHRLDARANRCLHTSTFRAMLSGSILIDR